MIPKIIHYSWLSNDPMPQKLLKCMASWKKHMPDWTIKHWGMDEFDVNSVPFVAEAVAARKWAFAADYIRVYGPWIGLMACYTLCHLKSPYSALWPPI